MKRIFGVLIISMLAITNMSCSGILADLGLGGDTKEGIAENDSEQGGKCDPEEEDCASESETAIASREPAEDDAFERNAEYGLSLRKRVRDAIESNDVIPGMTRSEVMQSWGAPVVREFAGQGDSGHERWIYGSRRSMRGETFLIFENGRVVGWHR